MPPKLILASTSPYRAALLAQLGLPFEPIDPEYLEQAQDLETPEAKASRLARGKAISGAKRLSSPTNSIVIGSDQVAQHPDGTILSKPGGFEQAHAQLSMCSGQWVKFSTAICLVDEHGQILNEGLEHYQIKYRSLSDSDIRTYLQIDKPYDCAGSLKAEGLGIHIIEEGRGKDINTLYGLPLILLSSLLNKLNYDPINNINKEL